MVHTFILNIIMGFGGQVVCYLYPEFEVTMCSGRLKLHLEFSRVDSAPDWGPVTSIVSPSKEHWI